MLEELLELPEINNLIKQAKVKGIISYEEILEKVPEYIITHPDRIDYIIKILEDNNINITETADTIEKEIEEAPVEHILIESDDEQNDNPLRIYLKKIGRVKLLSYAEEVQIAARIEEGQEAIDEIVFQSGFLITEIHSVIQDVLKEEGKLYHFFNLPKIYNINPKERKERTKLIQKISDYLNDFFETCDLLEEKLGANPTLEQVTELRKTVRDKRQDFITHIADIDLNNKLKDNAAENLLYLANDIKNIQTYLKKASDVNSCSIEDILAEHILFEPWKQFYKSVLTDSEIRKNFTEGFGAKTVHHAYMGGLLEHTLSVMNLCLLFTEQYPQIDKEILLIGALFHDIGKIEELKNNDHLADFTDEGKLLGHIQLGLELLYPFFKQAKNLPKPFISHLKHMILSHHGELEYGSPKLPATQEALLLHHADNIDAKMSMLDNFYETMQTNEQSWAYHRFLNRDIYLPEKTPTVNKKEKKGIKQCSLPLKG